MSVRVHAMLFDRLVRQLDNRPFGRDVHAGPDHPLTISTPGEQAGCTNSQVGASQVSAPHIKPSGGNQEYWYLVPT